MINYVNNAYDKVLKPCDAQRFSIIINSQETEKLILGHRGGDAKAKSKLPAITYMGVLDSDKYRKYLETPSKSSQARRFCEPKGSVSATEAPLASAPSMGRTQASRNKGTRKAEFMRPTGLLMMDFDHSSNPRAIYDALLSYLSSTETAPTSVLALAHITPSGDGLRLVLKREKGKSIAQEQYEWFLRIKEHYPGDLTFDDVCKDISRLSFAPMKSEVLYFNPSLLFAELPDAADYPDGSLWGTPSNLPLYGEALQTSLPTNGGNTPEALPIEGELSEGLWGSDFNGVPYSEIVRRLEEQLGGAPAQGARNSFIFSMACNLRYICNDDAAWVASILPTYGEEPQKHRQTIQSAINRPMSRTMPETMQRALGVAKECADNGQLTIDNGQLAPPQLPSHLPEPIALLTSRTPEEMKAAVAMSVFPPLGAHVSDLRFFYWDGRAYEPTFMNVLVAPMSAGKSAVNAPIEYIIADLERSDEAARNREREWREKCEAISTPDDKPKRPENLGTQILSSDMTNAAFVQRLADAKGKFLYTQMDEIELLNALKTNGTTNMVSAVLRLAFDCGKYGQERVAYNAVNAKVRVRWNWNASSTVQRIRKYFAKSIADGTLSRLSFATIIKDERNRKNKPKFGQYGERFAAELEPFIDRLKVCTGTLVCPEAEAWADRLGDELVDFADDAEDSTYAQLSYRAVLMGFFRAMLLYVMNGMRWTDEIAEFASWSVRYDLWCKMRFFRDMLHRDLEGEKSSLQRGPVGLLTMLPKEFTREQVRDLRIEQGMKSDPKAMISNWTKRGLIMRDDERGVYTRV